MAAKANAEAKSNAEAPDRPDGKASEVPKFAVKKLRSNCTEVFGVTSSTFDGAMHGHDLDGMYSIEEVKDMINDFMRR